MTDEFHVGMRVMTRNHGAGTIVIREVLTDKYSRVPTATGRFGVDLDDKTRLKFNPAYFYPEEMTHV